MGACSLHGPSNRPLWGQQAWSELVLVLGLQKPPCGIRLTWGTCPLGLTEFNWLGALAAFWSPGIQLTWGTGGHLMWEKRQKSRKNQCSVESSKWSPMKLNEFEIFSIEFWKYTWFTLVYGGTYGLPCKFCEKCLKLEKYTHLHYQAEPKNGHETYLDPISLDHLLGIQSCTQKTKFYTVLDRFWLVKAPIMTKLWKL